MRSVAVIPVRGRIPLLKLSITRLLERNEMTAVICLGETQEERDACTEAGARFIFHKNRPVARKLNTGFQIAAEYNPDAVLYLSSSDWISDNWMEIIEPYLLNYDMVGKLDCHFAHVGNSIRACYWQGYHERGMNLQPVGIGRVLSRYALEKMCWQPFDNFLNSSLDYSMIFKLMKHSDRRRIMIINSSEIASLSISSDAWSNIHSFHQLCYGSMPMALTWLDTYFPEIFELKYQLYGTM